MTKPRTFVLAALFGATFASAAMAQTNDQDAFYAGKTVTITVGFSPGGGYDQYGRLAAEFLGRHLPGKPTVLVSNMPGGGGLKAALHLFNTAPKDGTVLTLIMQSVAFDSALGNLAVPADQFNFIGRLTTSVEMQLTWRTSATKTLSDAKKRKTMIGATGASSPSAIVPKLLNDAIGTQFEIVAGYPGTTDSALAMERGEVEGTLKSLQSILSANQDWLDKKLVNVIWQLSMKPHPRFPDVPAVGQLGDDPQAQQMLRLIAGTSEIGRSLATAPGVPDERVRTLRKAFAAMIADPEFLAAAKKRNADLDPATGEELQQMVKSAMQTPPEVVARVKKVLARK